MMIVIAILAGLGWVGAGLVSMMMVDAGYGGGAPLWLKAVAVALGPLPLLVIGAMLR